MVAQMQMNGASNQRIGASSLQVVAVLPGDEPSYDIDHVVVDVLLSGSVRVRGLARTIGASTYLSSPVFPSLPQALVAAHAFAQKHGIARICLVNHTAPALLVEAVGKPGGGATHDLRSLAA